MRSGRVHAAAAPPQALAIEAGIDDSGHAVDRQSAVEKVVDAARDGSRIGVDVRELDLQHLKIRLSAQPRRHLRNVAFEGSLERVIGGIVASPRSLPPPRDDELSRDQDHYTNPFLRHLVTDLGRY